jgi:acetolactate synthase-1/2/3 large subunit
MAQLSSGHLAMRALTQAGVEHLFTLSGGHIFPLYEGCRHEDVRLIDVRHEQAATFAAEGMGKLTRRPGVAALTAGPGVTNGMSAMASARYNGSPLLVLGGRAPNGTWGSGGLQEIDHVAFVGPITTHAATATVPEGVAADVMEAYRRAGTPHRGPTFVDIPMDVIFSPADESTVPVWTPPEPAPVDLDALAEAGALLREAQRPVLVGGTDVWFSGAWEALRDLVEQAHVPVLLNGMGRGCLPADHDLVISAARGAAFSEADLVVVVGTPLDFRLGFGRFGSARVVHVMDSPAQLVGAGATPAGAPDVRSAVPPTDAHPLSGDDSPLAARVAGDLTAVLHGLALAAGGPTQGRRTWTAQLADVEAATQATTSDLLDADSDPIHPVRVYGELRRVLDRDAVVIGDGGDFVSFAGKHLPSYTPGCWMDPGPYGCLGTGTGYAMAARLARPDAQVVTLLGDGAAGFGLLDADTLVRHDLPVVMVVGNNGIWGLEKYPMRMIYDGWDAAADLQPGLRYDEVVRALGGAGETVEKAADLGPALERAFASGVPYLVNVLTDPAVAYPRSTVLA